MSFADHSRFELRRALTAARALAKDPDDLPQVFTVIEALSGGTVVRMARRFAGSTAGRRLLAEKPDIVALLEDRAALRRLPDGSVGRAYLDFVEAEGISPSGIRMAGAQGMTNRPIPPPFDYVHARMRDTHDLWHAVTGYKGDVLGETALLAFILAQTKNPGIALIVGVGLLKTLEVREARGLIAQGFLRGWRAAWLPAQAWESLLALPLSEVREQLKLGAPPEYDPLRSAEIRQHEAASGSRKTLFVARAAKRKAVTASA